MLQRGMTCFVAMAATVPLSGFVTAQEYPVKIVRLVIPYPPGGSAEAQARIVAQALQAEWKQSVVIENKPGAGTTLGAAVATESPASPDQTNCHSGATAAATTTVT